MVAARRSDVPLRRDQERALERARALDGRIGLFMEMGTGKTRVALLDTLDAGCRRILVVCPLPVTPVWEREARIVGCDLPTVDLTEDSSIAARAARLRATGDALVLINYESYWRKPLRDVILRWKPDAVVLDEGHKIRHRGVRHTKFAHSLADRVFVRRRLLLSGTPITNGLQDAWSLYRFIDPSVFGTTYLGFEGRYLVKGGYMNMEVRGFQNIEEAHQKIQDSSFQARKDLASLPPRRDILFPVRLGPAARALYEKLKADAIAEVTNAAGESSMVVAQIVLTLILRLQQIACGFVRDVGTELVEVSHEKTDAVMELIDQALNGGEKVVVFARFLHDLESVERRLAGTGRSYAWIRGGQSARERREIQAAHLAGEYDVLLGQIKAAHLGIDLTAASTAIFVSVGYSLDEFIQAKDRIHRPGQTRPVSYYHLIANRTVDAKVYTALRDKLNIAGQVTDLAYALDLIKGA